MKQAGHQHRREDEQGRETKKGDRGSREEQSVLDDTQEAGDSDRVVLVIVALVLLFIVIMAYFVAQMPPKP